MAEEGTGGRERGERGGRRKGPESEGEGPHDTLAWGPQCLNPALLAQAYVMSCDPIFMCHKPRLRNATKYQNYAS